MKPESVIEETPEKSAVTSETEKAEIPTVKNLSQLKKAIQSGMMFEITAHSRPECVGERRVVTGVTTVDFTSRKLDENGEPTGKDIHMEFDRAKNWSFDGGEMTSHLDDGSVLMSFHFIDGSELEKAVEKFKVIEPKTAGVENNSISAAFDQLKSQFNMTEKQAHFFRRLERFAINEQLHENLFEAAFEKSSQFRRVYGNLKNLSRNVFFGRMQRFSDALEQALRTTTTERNVSESTEHLTPAQQQAHEPISASKEQPLDLEQCFTQELKRGTGFEGGKFRVEKFYKENPKNIKAFAAMLKREFGIGGHTGNGNVNFVNHDGKGIEIQYMENGEEKIANFSWNAAAKKIGELIEAGKYITKEDVSYEIQHAQYVWEHRSSYDDFNIEKAQSVLKEYGMFQPDAPENLPENMTVIDADSERMMKL